jgi:hypothetical protein
MRVVAPESIHHMSIETEIELTFSQTRKKYLSFHAMHDN